VEAAEYKKLAANTRGTVVRVRTVRSAMAASKKKNHKKLSNQSCKINLSARNRGIFTAFNESNLQKF
jgi:hypothetical protein